MCDTKLATRIKADSHNSKAQLETLHNKLLLHVKREEVVRHDHSKIDAHYVLLDIWINKAHGCATILLILSNIFSNSLMFSVITGFMMPLRQYTLNNEIQWQS
jgi:hypothetical protein